MSTPNELAISLRELKSALITVPGLLRTLPGAPGVLSEAIEHLTNDREIKVDLGPDKHGDDGQSALLIVKTMRKRIREIATSLDGLMLRDAGSGIEGDLFPPCHVEPHRWTAKVGEVREQHRDPMRALISVLDGMSTAKKEHDA